MTAHITRIAPSPTGMFHLGSARTALFNWLIAKASGGKFMLRIDDTDAARNTPEAVQVIHQAIEWLDLDYDIFARQSDRFDLYERLANDLVKVGLARQDDGAIRLVADASIIPDAWVDTIKGKMAVSDQEKDNIDGMVLMKSNSIPTYHFASVVDDMDFGITWVVRGTDHISNTPKQIAIWKALGAVSYHAKDAPLPLWTHVGLITKDKKKISKRDGAASLMSYKEDGILPEALCNWLLKLGWGSTIDDKTMKTISREKAVELFPTGGKMRSSPANMDVKLLESLDRKYKAMAEKAKRATE